ncbi:MAG: TatD family hydrolase [Arcobacteraceae bacterium]|nr:TatD family hydrolase [Arcobacteraceae bacterium]
MIIDTHCHLDADAFQDDVDNLIVTSKEDGISHIIIPAADINDLPKAVALAEKYPQIYFSVGVHPYHIEEYCEKTLESYINHPKCVAVGECGLDYYRLSEDDAEKIVNIELQKKIFIAQIKLAKRYKKPLIIHIRDASNDSKAILLEHNAKEVGGVLHCFNADEQLLSLAKENFYFGIGGVVTFKNAKKLVNVLPKIPLDKLVLETDAPYLTPEPFRGKRNEPLYTKYVASKIGEILDMSVEDVEELTTLNAKRLFGNL